MRILHVNKFARVVGGVETHMNHLVMWQRQRGHDVTVFSAESLRHPGFDVSARSLRAKARSVATLYWSREAQRGLADCIEAFDPDVVHFHSVYHHLSPSVLRSAARAHVPCVMTLHDYKLVAPCYLLFRDGHECHLCVGKTFPSPGVRLRCVKSSVAASLTCAIEQSVHRPIYRDEVDAFIVPSTTARNLVLASGAVRAEDIHVVPHGVEIPAALATAQDGPAYMLFLGRLSPEKGGTCLLEAWRRANLGPDWELLIAGEGADRASLERQAAGMRIRFLGHVGDGEIQRLLYGAAAMVVPSLFPETFGLSAAEAMAAGVPVLVSNVGNLPDLVGRLEQVVAPGDPAAWADAIRDIAKSPTRRARLAATARERIETEFSPVVAAVRTEAVYVAAGADRSES